MLKIYSVQLHEKYHLVPLVSRRFVSHLGGCLDSSIFSPFSLPLSHSLFLLSHVSTYHPCALSLLPISSLSRSYALVHVFGSREPGSKNSFFGITMPSGAWYAEQFRICDYASRAISQLIGGARKACADAYPITRYIY